MISTPKRGPIYQLDCALPSGRIRCSLNTRDRQVASKLRSKVEIALAEGGQSRMWGDLQAVLPKALYTRLAAVSGAKNRVSHWGDLVSIFRTESERRIKAGTLSRNTLDRYERSITAFEQFAAREGVGRIEDITRDVVCAFRAWRKEQIVSRSRSKTANSLVLDMTVIRLVMAVAVENGWLAKNPVEAEPTPETIEGAEPFSGEELAKLRAACDPEHLLVFLVFRHTGMRGSDVADLQWQHLDLGAGVLNKTCIKNGKAVEIPLQAELLAALPPQSHHGHVVLLGNKPTDRAQLYRRLRLIGSRAKVESVHPHRFRDTLAVDLLLKGATPFEVSRILGDSLQTVEKHYLSFVAPMRDRVRAMMADTTTGLEAV